MGSGTLLLLIFHNTPPTHATLPRRARRFDSEDNVKSPIMKTGLSGEVLGAVYGNGRWIARRAALVEIAPDHCET